MDTDRNLLFAVLALQAELIDRDQFVQACTLWTTRKDTPLAEILVAQGWLTPLDRSDVQRLVDRKLKKHGGDAHASLAAVADDEVQRVLAVLTDSAIEQSLANLSRTDKQLPLTLISPPPNTHDRYTLTRLHAQGGIGQIWLAHDQSLGRNVALKELRLERVDRPELWARFVQEAKITGQLEHPGIVPVYELSQRTADRQPFYTMRFVQGRTLADAVKAYHQKRAAGQAGPLELRVLLNAFVSVCNAVAYAHSRGVIHRDLKGANVVLGDFGEVIVLDWGLAKVLGTTEENAGPPLVLTAETAVEATLPGQVLGTPAFMAPEQAAGRTDCIDPRTDVYGLGAILYQVLTGVPPFEGGDTQEVLRKICEQGPRPPRQLVAETPRALEAICLKALAKKREERYSTATALADDVQHWLADEPVTACPEPWTHRAARWTRRHRTLAVGLGAGLAAVVVFLGVLVGIVERARRDSEAERRRTEDARREADRRWEEARRNLYLAHLHAAEYAAEKGNAAEVHELLQRYREPPPGRTDLRGWEWYLQERLLHEDMGVLGGHEGDVNDLAFSPNGEWLASTARDGTIRVWDVAARQLLRTWTGHAHLITGIAFHPDGARLATGSFDRTIKIWDAADGRLLQTLTQEAQSLRIAFSPDGTQLASVNVPAGVQVWDVTAGRVVHRFPGHFAVRFSPDGTTLATGGLQGTVQVWDLKTQRLAVSLRGREGRVLSLAYRADGRRLASGGDEGTVTVWELPSGRALWSRRGHRNEVNAVAFSADGEHLASGGGDQVIQIWDTATGQTVRTLWGHTSHLNAVAFSPIADQVASAGVDQTIRLWNIAGGQPRRTLAGHRGQVEGVAFSPDGSRLASASADHTVRLWDVTTGQPVRTLEGHTGRVRRVVYQPRGDRLASAGDDGTVRLWHLGTATAALVLRGHTAPVLAVAFSPDGTRVASAGDDRIIRLWDAGTGSARAELRGHRDRIRAVAFSPDGRLLASASHDYTTKVWDLATGEAVLDLRAQGGGWFMSVAFSPDGKYLVTGSGFRVVTVWDVATGQPQHALPAHRADVFDLAFSPDGSRLFSASVDRTVKVWDVATWQVVRTLAGPAGHVSGVAVHPDGYRVASSGADGKVVLWDARPLTPAVQEEREALGLLDGLFGKPLLKEEVLAAVRTLRTIPPAVRERALALAEAYQDDPDRFNNASWLIVREPRATPERYRRALQWAETACRLAPESAECLNTLGVAQYRVGRYREALATLRRSDEKNTAQRARQSALRDLGLLLMSRWLAPLVEGDYGLAEDVAFLAMVQHQLGERARAQESLARLRYLVQKTQSPEARAVLREAEELIEGPSKPTAR